jgi:hypothetical protein
VDRRVRTRRLNCGDGSVRRCVRTDHHRHRPTHRRAGFRHGDLRGLLAELLDRSRGQISAQQISYDLRRLRMHGLIARIPGRHRYRLSDIGLHHDMLLTHIHTRH